MNETIILLVHTTYACQKPAEIEEESPDDDGVVAMDRLDLVLGIGLDRILDLADQGRHLFPELPRHVHILLRGRRVG